VKGFKSAEAEARCDVTNTIEGPQNINNQRVRNYDKESVEDSNRNTWKSNLCAISIRKSSKFLNLFLSIITPVQTPKLGISVAMPPLSLYSFVV